MPDSGLELLHALGLPFSEAVAQENVMPERSETFRDCASFTVVAVLIFIGMSLALEGWVATGPNQWASLGLTGWLELHRYMDTWSIEHVDFARLIIEGALAILVTWLLLKVLHGSRKSA